MAQREREAHDHQAAAGDHRRAGSGSISLQSLQDPRPRPANHHTEWFSRFAHETARLSGKPAAFILAAAIVVVWGITGPLFNYSDTWQLVINTGTTIITFLMVFLIQNTQNRDTMALQVKLAELIIAVRGAHNRLATAEDLTEDELEQLHREYCQRADAARESLEERRARR